VCRISERAEAPPQAVRANSASVTVVQQRTCRLLVASIERLFDDCRMEMSQSAAARQAERTRLARRVQPTTLAADQLLPVLPPLAPLLPHGGLRRGGVVTVSGSLRLALALAAGVTQGNLWAAFAGIPELGVVAAAETGVALQRLALIPNPGVQWAPVIATLLDEIDLVITRPPAACDQTVAHQLATRARERRSVLVMLGIWPSPDLNLHVDHEPWIGLEAGAGYLQQRRARVIATGRGSATRPREAWLWLPFRDGTVQPATDR
jgi:hypothetical protein